MCVLLCIISEAGKKQKQKKSAKMNLMGPLNRACCLRLLTLSSLLPLTIWCLSSSRLYYHSRLEWVFDHVIWVTVPHPHLGSHKLAPGPSPVVICCLLHVSATPKGWITPAEACTFPCKMLPCPSALWVAPPWVKSSPSPLQSVALSPFPLSHTIRNLKESCVRLKINKQANNKCSHPHLLPPSTPA